MHVLGSGLGQDRTLTLQWGKAQGQGRPGCLRERQPVTIIGSHSLCPSAFLAKEKVHFRGRGDRVGNGEQGQWIT